MIAHIRDVSPAEEDEYTILRGLITKQLEEFIHSRMTMAIGIAVGVFLSGVAVTLGVSSILLLSSRNEVRSKRHYFLCIYTTILLLCLVAFETLLFVDSNGAVTFPIQSPKKIQENSFRMAQVLFAILLVIIALVDALLVRVIVSRPLCWQFSHFISKVWRCFLVQKVLGRGSSNWGHLFWVFPAILWGIALGTIPGHGY